MKKKKFKPKTPKYPDGGSTSVAKPRILSEEEVAFAQLPKWKQEAIKKQNLIQGSRKQEEKLSVGKNLTKEEKETSDKISRRIKYPFSDLGIAAGNIASYLTRLHGLSEEEIVKATNNISGTLSVTNDIALHALANELGQAGVMKATSKINNLKKVEKVVANKYKAEDFKSSGKQYTVDNLQDKLSKPVQKGIPNPIKIADDIVPRLDPLSFTEDASLMEASPLNMLSFYGNKLKGKDKAFRKFGNSLEHVIESKTLSPKGGSKFRMGKDQIINEGNWAALNRTWEKYPGTYAAEFNFKTPGSNLGYVSSNSRSGVLITDAAGNKLPDVPLSDPGLQLHRRLPFSTRYVPIDKEKLINNQWQLATQGSHLQSLAEKYGYGLGATASLGALSGDSKGWVDKYNEYTIDPLINLVEEQYNNMKKLTPLTNKKYKNGGAVDELKNVGLFAADMMLAEWAPNAIKQDQYADTKFGKQLGNVAAVNESLSSQSPISKNVSKNWNDNKTGYNQTQMNYYKQAQPIAKTGSKIGEMWAGSAMGGVGGEGMMGQMIQGGAQQGLNAQYDPTQNIQWNDPNNPEGQYPYGGVYNLMHPFAKPGLMYMNKFPMGGNVVNPNAQLELEENTLNPDGSTTQFNLPPHEQQHPNAGTQLQPDTMIFSDKLRPKGEKKSYAQLNKINNTDKETKILGEKLSNPLSLKTANLMKQVKNNNSMKLFNDQESLKASKINSYIKRLGGKFTYPDGGPYTGMTNYSNVDAAGFPVDKTGRRLSNPEMLGFSRPGYTYGSATTAGRYDAEGINPLTGKVNLGIQDQRLQSPTVNTMPQFTYDPSLVDESGRNLGYQAQWDNYLSKNPLPKNAMGGLFKYRNAGYGPKTQAEDNQYYTNNSAMPFIGNPANRGMEFIGNPNYKEPAPGIDPNLTYQSPWDSPEGIAAMKNNNNQSSNKANWGNMAYQAGSWLANNLGELAYLKDNGKKYDKQDFYEYTPELMDPTASLRDADNMARIARYDLADKSVGNSGNYMANRSGLAVNTMLAKDKIRQEYGNINAGIKNQGKQYNIKNKYMTDDITARNKGAAYNQYFKSLERMGTNTAQGMKDNKASKMDQKTLDMMGSMFSNFKYDPSTNSWIFKK